MNFLKNVQISPIGKADYLLTSQFKVCFLEIFLMLILGQHDNFDHIWLKCSFFDEDNPINFDQIWLKNSVFDRGNSMNFDQTWVKFELFP